MYRAKTGHFKLRNSCCTSSCALPQLLRPPRRCDPACCAYVLKHISRQNFAPTGKERGEKLCTSPRPRIVQTFIIRRSAPPHSKSVHNNEHELR